MQDRLGTHPAYQFLHTFWVAVDWLYPPRCGGCQISGTRWCADCERKIDYLGNRPICLVCGIPQNGSPVCADCRNDPPPFRALRSCATYQGPLREAIQRLKYRADLGLSEIFAQKLAQLYTSYSWPVDFVTVVPLSKGRIKERGYNQADMIARTLALAIGKPYRPTAIERIRETQSQVGLSAAERRLNVQGAFIANEKIVAGRNVLIIDDVTTTGSTMNACSLACMQKSAKNVYGLTVARAVITSHT